MCLGPWTLEGRIEELEAELELERNRHEETKSQLLEKESENQRLLAEIQKLKLSALKKKKKPCKKHVKRLPEIPEVIPVKKVNLTSQEDSEDIQKTSDTQKDHELVKEMENLEILKEKNSEELQKASESQKAPEFQTEMENLEISEESENDEASKDSEGPPSSETQKDPENTHQPSETQSKIASLETTYSHLLNLKDSSISHNFHLYSLKKRVEQELRELQIEKRIGELRALEAQQLRLTNYRLMEKGKTEIKETARELEKFLAETCGMDDWDTDEMYRITVPKLLTSGAPSTPPSQKIQKVQKLKELLSEIFSSRNRYHTVVDDVEFERNTYMEQRNIRDRYEERIADAYQNLSEFLAGF